MNKSEVYATLTPKMVLGENITLTSQFMATGNAELEFVALSQIYTEGRHAADSYWIVPAGLYLGLKQDAVLLKRDESNAAARALLPYLQSDPAKDIIRSYGYTL